MLFFNLSRNELNKKSSRPNMIRGRTWHRMNRGGRRGKEGIRGKRGTGDGERSRTRPVDAPRRRVPKTRHEDARCGGTRATAACVFSSEQSHLVAAALASQAEGSLFSAIYTGSVRGRVWNARAQVPRAFRVWDWLTEHNSFSLDAIETRRFPSF